MARTPESIGKYKVESRIAQGGMGAVFKAQHPTLGRPVTIKRLTLRGNAAVRERFKREASIMMDFRSDFIVDVYDHFREGSSYHIVQEWVDGLSLEELLERERYLSNEFALLIFRDCCRALKYAHDRNVVHRDIKPGNILISKSGQVKLVDFGIASIRGDQGSTLTREDTTLGTPTYMAPEQFESTHNVDKRGDIYSLGVMLYEMVTGKKPFPNSMSAQTVRLIQQGSYRRPRKVNPKVSRRVQRLVRRCMKPKRKRRYPDLDRVLRALQHDLPVRTREQELERIRRYLAGENLVPLGRRAQRIRRVAAAVVLLGGVGALAYFAYDAGYQYRLLWPDEYGAARLSARIHKDARPAAELSIQGRIYRIGGAEAGTANEDASSGSDGRGAGGRSEASESGEGAAGANESRPFADPSASFRPNPHAETADYLVYDSKRVFLPVGTYRAKLAVGDTLYWESFVVRPLSQGSSRPRDPATRRIQVTHDPMRPLPLELDVRVRDRLSGEDLPADDTRVYLSRDGVWERYRDDVELESGGTLRLRISRPGYHAEQLRFSVEPWQTTLHVSAGLVPRSGTLRIESEEEGRTLLLDGSRRYLAGGPEPAYRTLPKTKAGETEVELPPGTYRLELRGEEQTARVSITVHSGEVSAVRAYRNEDGTLRVERAESGRE